MKYFHQRRSRQRDNHPAHGLLRDDDPLKGVINLFDIGMVFIVGLIMALFSVYHLQDLFNETSSFTILKQNMENKEMEIITKTQKKITAMKVTREKIEGRGQRLGIAYKLEDGTMVYVPE